MVLCEVGGVWAGGVLALHAIKYLNIVNKIKSMQKCANPNQVCAYAWFGCLLSLQTTWKPGSLRIADLIYYNFPIL
jgi:hypothetical protein